VAERSKAGFCGRSHAEIVGSHPSGGHGCLSVVSVVCCVVSVVCCVVSVVCCVVSVVLCVVL